MRTAAILLAVLAAPLGAQQPMQPQPPAPPPQVVTTGSAEVKVMPDRATVMVTVETRGRTAAAAAAENARTTRVTLDALRAQGIPNELLGTADYNVYPEQTYDEKTRRPIVTGYVARNTVRAEVRKVEQVGNVIDAALAGGANTIGGIEFWSSNVDQARRTAIAGAVSKACLDAEAMARAANASLGMPLEISMAPFNEPRPMMAPAAYAKRDMAESVPTPINPGEQTLTVMVSTRWALLFGPAAQGSSATRCITPPAR